MTTSTHDLVIVGGGIGGVIALRYARAHGLSAVVLEQQGGVGGLWRTLPAWQDLQILKEDWTLGDVPIAGEDAASVRANIQAWVERFALADAIVTGCRVTGAEWRGEHWEVQSTQGPFRGRFLVAATGAHNRPRIPEVTRRSSTMAEYHSSTLHDASVLAGKRVTVVGGGASAQDVLVQALEHGAAELHWVYRSLNWFTPTSRRKQDVVALRFLGKQQLLGVSATKISKHINEVIGARFKHYDITSLRPTYAFDLRRHHLIPGRARLLAELSTVARHTGEVAELVGDTVVTKAGERFGCDAIVWGTGFDVDLGWLGLADLTAAKTPREVARRLRGFSLARNHPNLFVFGPALLDTNGSAPFFYCHLAKAMARHILGHDTIPVEVVEDQVNYFDLVRLFAKADRRSYPPAVWRLPYLRRLWNWRGTTPLPLP